MRAISLLAAAAALAVIAPSALAVKVKGPGGYTMDIPKGWTVRPNPSSQPEFAAVYNPRGGAVLALNVVTAAAPKGTKLDTAWRGICDGAREAAGFVLVREGKSTFAGEPAGYCEYTCQAGNPARTLWLRQTVLLHGGRIVTISCLSPADASPLERQKVIECANSFAWLRKGTVK